MVVKRQVDWDQVAIDIRAGVLTDRQIGERHGRSHGAIQQYAKKHGIERDKSARRLMSDKTVALKSSSEKVVLHPDSDMASSGFVYVIYIDTGIERLYKIGLAKHFGSRFDQHQCSSPFEICVALAYFVGNMRLEERDLHATFADSRVRGEWFRLTRDDLERIAKRALLV